MALVIESDIGPLGKMHEFSENVYKPLKKYLLSTVMLQRSACQHYEMAFNPRAACKATWEYAAYLFCVLGIAKDKPFILLQIYFLNVFDR